MYVTEYFTSDGLGKKMAATAGKNLHSNSDNIT